MGGVGHPGLVDGRLGTGELPWQTARGSPAPSAPAARGSSCAGDGRLSVPRAVPVPDRPAFLPLPSRAPVPAAGATG